MRASKRPTIATKRKPQTGNRTTLLRHATRFCVLYSYWPASSCQQFAQDQTHLNGVSSWIPRFVSKACQHDRCTSPYAIFITLLFILQIISRYYRVFSSVTILLLHNQTGWRDFWLYSANRESRHEKNHLFYLFILFGFAFAFFLIFFFFIHERSLFASSVASILATARLIRGVLAQPTTRNKVKSHRECFQRVQLARITSFVHAFHILTAWRTDEPLSLRLLLSVNRYAWQSRFSVPLDGYWYTKQIMEAEVTNVNFISAISMDAWDTGIRNNCEGKRISLGLGENERVGSEKTDWMRATGRHEAIGLNFVYLFRKLLARFRESYAYATYSWCLTLIIWHI